MTQDDLGQIKAAIREMMTEFECPPCEEEWLTTQQFCESFQISEPTLRAMRRRGDVEFKCFGRSYRYRG